LSISPDDDLETFGQIGSQLAGAVMAETGAKWELCDLCGSGRMYQSIVDGQEHCSNNRCAQRLGRSTKRGPSSRKTASRRRVVART
jgi:hypothetical protein